jgi:hypothetical protein
MSSRRPLSLFNRVAGNRKPAARDGFICLNNPTTNPSKTEPVMNPINQWLTAAGMALVLAAGGDLAAQSQQSTNRVEDRSPRGPDWANMDGQQIQQFMQRRMMETYRQRLEVTDDAEWKIIEERLGKVTQARLATVADGAGLMGMGSMAFGRGGPGRGGDGPGRGWQGLFGQPSAEAQELQKAIDAKAPTAEIKAKLAKLQEARKQKQTELLKAQKELREVLLPRQEAIAVLMGLLD